jgi:hypothetical protein
MGFGFGVPVGQISRVDMALPEANIPSMRPCPFGACFRLEIACSNRAQIKTEELCHT